MSNVISINLQSKATLLKSNLGMSVLLYICCIFSDNLLLKIPLNGCFWNINQKLLCYICTVSSMKNRCIVLIEPQCKLLCVMHYSIWVIKDLNISVVRRRSEAVALRCSVKVAWKCSVPRIFAKFVGIHLCQGLFFNKVASLIKLTCILAATLLKNKLAVTLLINRLWYRCFLVSFAKFVRTLFLAELLR